MPSPTPHRFTVKGRTFEVRSLHTSDGLKLECFENDMPTGVRASVTREVSSDFKFYTEGSAEMVLVDALERYVRDVLEHQ